MGFLDNFIGWVSPEWGARRQAWRMYLDELRHYDAGDFSRINSGWVVTNQSAEYTDRYSRDRVRARARDLERNSDIMNSVIGAFMRNTIGSGYVLQSTAKRQKTAQEIEKLWKTWCRKQNCDVTGTQSFNQMLRMAVRRKKVDGGVLFVKRFTEGGVLPFKLQMFEVDELDGSQVLAHGKANRVVGGIEYDQYNRPVGYWLKQWDLDGLTSISPVYIDAQDVIFYYSKHRPSQLREMSDMSQTITRIRDLNELMTAVAVKQRIEACFGIAIKKDLPTTGTLGRGATAVPDGPRQTYAGKTLSPGMMLEMNAGDSLETINPQGQATDAAQFVKLQQRLIASGQGISYEATARDMSESNYSSTRQGLIEDSLTYADEEELLMEVMDEIFETFVISAVLAGKVTAPGFWDKKEEYFEHRWVKKPKPWIDPVKESTATKTALQTGQKTFKQVAAENGSDWKTQVDDIAEVLKYAIEKHGIDLGGVILGAKETTVQLGDTPGNGGGNASNPPGPQNGGGDGKDGGPPAGDAADTDKKPGTSAAGGENA